MHGENKGPEFQAFVENHLGELNQFLKETDTLILVGVDPALQIIAHNACFQKIVKSGESCLGHGIREYLFPESRGLLPLPETAGPVTAWLHFMAADGSPVPLNCQIFKSLKNDHLICGGHLMLARDEIIEKMTVLTNEMANLSRDLHRKNRELAEAHSKLKILGGIIPICMHCKEIRDDQGYWNQLEKFISEHSEAQFSHGICDKCLKKYYPELMDDRTVDK